MSSLLCSVKTVTCLMTISSVIIKTIYNLQLDIFDKSIPFGGRASVLQFQLSVKGTIPGEPIWSLLVSSF